MRPIRREEKQLAYREMFREYPDALMPEQVQQMLGIGRRLTYRLLQEGKITSVRTGRLYRIPKIAVIDYLCAEGNDLQKAPA